MNRQEVTYRWNVDSGEAEFVGCGLGRAYGRESGWVYGTIDVDNVQYGSIADWKFEGSESHTEPVESNPQMLFAAMCKAKVDRIPTVRATLYHFEPDGSWWKEECVYDALDLDIFEAALRKCIANVREAEAVVAKGGTPDVQRGNWCRYCGAAASCPAVTGLIRSMAAEPQLTADQIRAALTPATAARAYQRLAEVKQAINAVSQAIYLYASECPIDLGDGRFYGARKTSDTDIDARKARQILAAKFGVEVAEEACDFKTSKAAIGRAIGPIAKAKKDAGEKVTKKALVEQTLGEIEAAGGITKETKYTVREYRNGESDNG